MMASILRNFCINYIDRGDTVMFKQKVKAKKQSISNAKVIAMTAMFSALITVTTAFIKIPSPFGYSHAGDSMIYLGASILPGYFGIIAASIGGALADLISGYAHWALPTALIKTLNAVPFVICGKILKKHNKDSKIINVSNILMIIPTTIVTVAGYFIANCILYSWEAATAELAVCWLQPGVGALLYVAIGLGLDSIKFKQKMLPNILR